ncbi:hypothetical protein [Haloplanus aerogenes]|uniref:Uncharacterized protein n=1 Tax=Haloplanus aerogenes TaxID=660522 RepID=A0A3M0CUX0_9EURY|nr:hypothetical protein [Haloplanus aerogenes]AZH26527.1 hypothetical protein DU502_14605 [Haloplanus aerogenes]RMB12755.1 hypothetical protein ATH50_2906 [Haloplanus aerogenes]
MRRPGLTSDDGDEQSGGSRFSLGARFRRLFAPRVFLLALVLSVVGLVAGGLVPVVGYLGRFLGIALAGFALAFLVSGRRYVEVGLAGALTAGLGFVLGTLNSVLFPVVADYGLQIAGVGTTAGLLAALVGHYFGRDLRAGLTKELS